MKVTSARFVSGLGWSDPLPRLDSPLTLVLAFGDSHRSDPSAWDELEAAFPTSVVIGCSTSGQILGPHLCDGGIVATVAVFEQTRLVKASAHVHSGLDSRAAGAHLGARLAAPDLRGVFVLSDGLHVNGSELVGGLLAAVGDQVVVTGGLAGDADRFRETWVLDEGQRDANRCVAVGFYGEAVDFGAGTCGGWMGFGPQRRVTRSSGNVLYELDGEPALGLYRRYLGELASDLPASALLVPLSVRLTDGAEPVVRTVLAVDEAHQSMTFAGDVPQDSIVQLMRSSADRLIDGAASAATMSAESSAPSVSALSIAVSCVGRRLVLRDRTDEEIEASLDHLPADTAMIGFYSYGEIAPSRNAASELHNQTMTITTITEAAAR